MPRGKCQHGPVLTGVQHFCLEHCWAVAALFFFFCLWRRETGRDKAKLAKLISAVGFRNVKATVAIGWSVTPNRRWEEEVQSATSIGVLFRLVWLKIAGTGLDGFYSVYQGHLFFSKRTPMAKGLVSGYPYLVVWIGGLGI